MSNDYYNVTGAPVTHSAGRSAVIRDEYTLIQQGFDKLPSQTEIDILKGATVTTAELNILDGATLSTAELNLLDGVTATTAEINYLDGVTGNLQIQLDNKADIDGETYTGTHNFTGATITVPTLSAGASGSQAASLDFVNAVAFASYANLPGQTDNQDKFLTTDGTNATWDYVPETGLINMHLGII